MTNSSYICNLIKNNPDNWEYICEEKSIKIKRDGELAIFNYGIDADFSDPIVQEARGIILRIEQNDINVVCWPFRKFGNSHESYVDTIDWSTAHVQEKIDGSIIKYWYNPISKKWQFSSNSCINANDAELITGFTLLDLIKRTKEYSYIVSDKQINSIIDLTYIFELVSQENCVVIRYDEPKLYHIGTRNCVNGEEYNLDIGIDRPKEYPLNSLEDCLNAVKKLNNEEYPDHEGFVVVDDKFHRIKIKAPEYLLYHNLSNNGGVVSKERAFDVILSDDFNLDAFIESAPSNFIRDAIIYYKNEYDNALNIINELVKSIQEMVKNNLTRKEIALNIKNNKYSAFGFASLEDGFNIMQQKYQKMLIKSIPDYTCDILNEKEDNNE